MSKPTPAHHKTVRVPFATVAKGYSGVRKIREAGPGLWEIVGVSQAQTPGYAPHPAMHETIAIVVVPARGVDQ
jgi:hypothetical protein